jgi:3-keto-5-aminohexanoate cleavage enzyme
MDKLIITCAITGAETTKDQCPALPVDPDAQAQAAYECWQAGASVIHLHVRDEKGAPTQSLSRFKEAIEKIRAKCPVIIQISTGGAVGDDLKSRMAPLALKPEMASLNMGSINFGDAVFQNLPSEIEAISQEIYRNGIEPELEIYDMGMLEYTLKLIGRGQIKTPAHMQFVLGTPSGLSGDVRNIVFLKDLLPANTLWSAAGIGRAQLPVAIHSLLMGGHVRVGLEDNIYWSKGVLAKSNAQLVDRVRTISESIGRQVASVEEARKMLNLK